ncbi:MAG: hypothetical protein ACHQ4H_11345 [Ktedonobacterales bacterium]
MDENELEVSRLRPHREAHTPPTRRRMGRGGRRLAVTLLSGFCMALALAALLLLTQPDPGAALGALLDIPTATPTPPLAIGAGIVFFEHQVPWGVLTVDGQHTDTADLAQANSSDGTIANLDVALVRGRHTVAYDAPPFVPVRCTITVPASSRDTCPLWTPTGKEALHVVGAARVLDLRATIDHLPPAELAALTAAAQSAVAITVPAVTVAAGERYLGADGMTHVAAQAQHATLFREPWRGVPVFSGESCVFLCPALPGGGIVSGTWELAAEVRQGFRFTSATGAVLAEGALTWTPGGLEQPQGLLVAADTLSVRWDGAWQVAVDSSVYGAQLLTCQAAQSLTGQLKGAYGGAGGPNYQPLTPIAAANPTDGCITGYQEMLPDGSKGARSALLYRFGLLLTIDPASRAAFPYLPQADAGEQAIAQQILAQSH